jgi:hypothetical protein
MTDSDKFEALNALRAESAGLCDATAPTRKLTPEELAEVHNAIELEDAGICDAAAALTTSTAAITPPST